MVFTKKDGIFMGELLVSGRVYYPMKLFYQLAIWETRWRLTLGLGDREFLMLADMPPKTGNKFRDQYKMGPTWRIIPGLVSV